jgi:bifunctional DNase/RNase
MTDVVSDEHNDDRDGVEAPTDTYGGDVPERFIPVRFLDVELTLPSTHPTVILEEIDPPHRQLRIPIGIAEGSAIAYAARQIPTPRPLTHEFATAVLEGHEIVLETVRITEVVGTSFAAEAIFSSGMGVRTFSCRPSDGICFALRQHTPTPIAVAVDVLDEMGYEPQ